MSMRTIDLRSDTVTLPTPEMRAAMAQAEVGDDVYGEDPTVNHLQELAADMLSKEAGLFVASGTMGNLTAILAHCTRGDEVILGNKAHTFLYEAGGTAALGGVHSYIIPNQPDGTLKPEDIRSAIRSDNVHFPISKLVVLENTHNRCGGVALSGEYTREVAKLTNQFGLKLHIDGARLFNAAVSLKTIAKELASPADSVTICLSKGLCAPVGSVLCGTKEFIARAHRIRKQLGGGMRQAGILAAAGIIALEKMVGRLAEDHDRAKLLASGLATIPGIVLNFNPPHTNMVFLSLTEEVPKNAAQIAASLARKGVRVGVIGERSFRLVTHYWVDDEKVKLAVEAFREAIQEAHELD